MPFNGSLALLASCAFTLALVAWMVRVIRRPSFLVLARRIEAVAEKLGARRIGDDLVIDQGGRAVYLGTVPGRRAAPVFEVWSREGGGGVDPGDDDYRTARAAAPAVPSRPTVLLRLETGSDKLGKLLRINRELQTGDLEFDRRVYVESDASDAEVLAALGGPRAHAAFVRLLELGPAYVLINGHDTAAVSAAYDRVALAPLEAGPLAEIALRVADVADALPASEGPVDPPHLLRRPSSLVALVVLVVGLGATAVQVAYSVYPVCDRRDVRPVVVAAVVPWFLAVVGAARVVRGRPTSFRSFVLLAVALAVATPLFSVAGAVMVNGGVDTSPPQDRSPTVLVMQEKHGRHGTDYLLELAPWRPGARAVEVSVKQPFYASLHVGAPVRLVTHRGAFGWEWWQHIHDAK